MALAPQAILCHPLCIISQKGNTMPSKNELIISELGAYCALYDMNKKSGTLLHNSDVIGDVMLIEQLWVVATPDTCGVGVTLEAALSQWIRLKVLLR